MSITVTPAGSISLCRTTLENDYKNTLTWSNINAQTNYFNNLPNKVNLTEYTYMKKDGKIRVSIPIDDIINYNYCYYNNGGFTTKRYYCFITRMEFVNENLTDVFIETDVFQTWYFDIVWNRCFVEREHVNNDTIGVHTIPEGLETGEYVCNGIGNLATNLKNCYVCAMVTVIPDGITVNTLHTRYGGVFCGGVMIVLDSFLSAANLCRAYDMMGKGDAITAMFMIPQSLVGTIESGDWFQGKFTKDSHTIEFRCAIPDYTDNETLLATATITRPTTLNGYTPKNNKLLVWPYNYFYISNTVGTDVEYRYEDFLNGSPSFKTIGCITPGGSIRSVPMNYKLLADTETSYNHFNAGVPAPKFPLCSWQNDAYTNWLTQNAVNIGASIASDLGSIAIGGAMLSSGMAFGGAGSVINGVTGIAGTLGTIYQHSLIPPHTRGNTNTGDVAYASGSLEQPYYKMCIKYEMAEVIDNYFSMFGYKVNMIKIPNITGRSQWNFIKTIDCNADGNIPQEDLDTIKKACNAGITFWHNPANMYNYSLSNTIV